MIRRTLRAALVSAVFVISGCATTGGPGFESNEFLCAAAGALVGGGGAAAFGNDGRATGMGAAIGAGLGYLACHEGEPEPEPDVDTDGDGVVDARDACPGTRRFVEVDARGCPKDSDGDGVYNGIDRCPGTPAGAKVDERGCELDSDGDGVVDSRDRCPGTPAGVSVDADGCPLKDEVLFSFEGVNFDFNKATIRPEARPELDEAVSSLEQSPSLTVRVEGHTDSVGPDSYNQKLSERRAQSVADYLVDAGISRARLTVVGYGESRPIAPNDSERGRARNRRVDLVADD